MTVFCKIDVSDMGWQFGTWNYRSACDLTHSHMRDMTHQYIYIITHFETYQIWVGDVR